MKTLTLYRPRDFGSRDFASGVLENALTGFDRYMDSFFGNNFVAPSERIFSRLPSVDVQETEKAYILEAELPGFDEKDIEIRLDNNNLTIESRMAEEKNEEKEKNYLIQERRVSSFSRSFKLPENADSEAVSASFKNGVLSLEIGKKAEAQAKLIKITKN